MHLAALLLLSTICIGPSARKERGPRDDNSRMVDTISLNALGPYSKLLLQDRSPLVLGCEAPLFPLSVPRHDQLHF